MDLEGKVNFGQVESENENLVEKYGIEGFPTVLVFDAKGEHTEYMEPNESQDLIDFAKKLI